MYDIRSYLRDITRELDRILAERGISQESLGDLAPEVKRSLWNQARHRVEWSRLRATGPRKKSKES